MGEAVVRMLLVFLDKPILVESQLTKVGSRPATAGRKLAVPGITI